MVRLNDEPIGTLTWDRFLRHAVHCTNLQGSALFDATQGDEQLILDMYEEAKEKQSKKVVVKNDHDGPWRPPRRGYTRVVEKLDDLTDNIIALRAEQGNWKRSSVTYVARPLFPSQAVDELMLKRSRSRRDDAIKRSQERWRQRNGTHPGP